MDSLRTDSHGLDSFRLRTLAIISMLIDHIAAVLMEPGMPGYIFLRSVGRLAFPIFCFLIVEGLVHTRSVWKYMARLAIFAVISEIPFDLATKGRVIEFAEGQNVFITLLLGLAAITAVHMGAPLLLKKLGAKEALCGNVWMRTLVASPAILLCGWLAEKLSTDYGYAGVVFICVLYIFRDNRAAALVAMSIANVLCLCVHYRLADGSGIFYRELAVCLYRTPQLWACLAALPLGFYNGQQGTKKYRNWFYCFYPAHLLLLGLIDILIN
ncbi:MAG: hypothetical protein E7559_01555 [Ruminococcaceae bacterium]|nr:hypothetical protein [Oscillospiraceae bacterium]